jgi:chromate transporter
MSHTSPGPNGLPTARGEASLRDALPDQMANPSHGVSLPQLGLYFLRLGALGFGGPIALANEMRRDLVEQRRWITEEEYESGLAIAAACPGPLAYQLGVYCGYVRFGARGGLVAAFAFALAPFVLVVMAARAYAHFANTWQLRAIFYGVGPAVVALILKAGWNLGARTLRKDVWAWTIAAVACGVTAVVQRELVLLFVAAGVLGIFVFGPSTPLPKEPPRTQPSSPHTALGVAAPLFMAGPTAKLFLFFFKTGCLVFGSGLVIVPFLKTYVVDEYHWLGNREFLDAVAIGLISPGPVVITATFVGYLVGGFNGAVAGTLGIFSPAVLFTILATPLLRRYSHNPGLRGFVRGVTVSVVGVLVGTTYMVAHAVIGDALTLGITVLGFTAVSLWRRCPDPLLVGAGALIGLATYRVIHPNWLLR